MLLVEFLRFWAMLLLAGGLTRLIELTWKGSPVSQALGVIY